MYRENIWKYCTKNGFLVSYLMWNFQVSWTSFEGVRPVCSFMYFSLLYNDKIFIAKLFTVQYRRYGSKTAILNRCVLNIILEWAKKFLFTYTFTNCVFEVTRDKSETSKTFFDSQRCLKVQTHSYI